MAEDKDMTAMELIAEAGLIVCGLDPKTGEVLCRVTEEELAAMKSEGGVMPEKVVLEVVSTVKRGEAPARLVAAREPVGKDQGSAGR